MQTTPRRSARTNKRLRRMIPSSRGSFDEAWPQPFENSQRMWSFDRTVTIPKPLVTFPWHSIGFYAMTGQSVITFKKELVKETSVSERRAANLLGQVRWRDGVYCPRCHTESRIQYGSYRVFRRYRCKNCDHTFNDQTGTVFEHSSVALRKWFLALYTYVRLNTSIRQLDVEIDVAYKTVYRRVQCFLRALDAPQPSLEGPVEIDELYVKAGLKGRERDGPSRSRDLSIRERGTYHEDKLSVFILVDRGTDDRYVMPAKNADDTSTGTSM